ncbi:MULTISPECIES: hypothetical protein [unclassified Microcoleus]|uniref:hypothetical protein n=1 Tax=unclassified Microcoleus TaxID=2642155 RepID=UPI0025CB8217|nr:MULTISPECIES: hypothetical protein [unclassified Microcoleus]
MNNFVLFSPYNEEVLNPLFLAKINAIVGKLQDNTKSVITNLKFKISNLKSYKLCVYCYVLEDFTRKNWSKARPPEREKLKSGYSLLEYSDFSVGVALKLSTVKRSTVNC